MERKYFTREFDGRELFNLVYGKHEHTMKEAGVNGDTLSVSDVAIFESDTNPVTYVITPDAVYTSISKTVAEKLELACKSVGVPFDITVRLEKSRSGRQYVDFDLV